MKYLIFLQVTSNLCFLSILVMAVPWQSKSIY